MRYEFDNKILDDNLEEMKVLYNNDKEKFDEKFREIEDTMYKKMRKHYNDLRDDYEDVEDCETYHNVMNEITLDFRESDAELTKILHGYMEKIRGI